MTERPIHSTAVFHDVDRFDSVDGRVECPAVNPLPRDKPPRIEILSHCW